MKETSKVVLWVAIAMVLAAGLIHVIDGPDALEEATYKGILFYANGLAALIAAIGIYQQKAWGWYLGLAVCLGSIAGYVASRTIGLPGIPAEPDAWLEPLGVASLIVEGIFVLLYKKVMGCGCCCKV